ncbi:Conjugal transfer protein [Labrenzia sp. THAF82]|nr:TrbG/VirB9 family P-type conjugative transfer protein [Labrenzia sp. THAF82]QFT29524.1 Conjugal transfer protein [Labrenzia sp. THAF82]
MGHVAFDDRGRALPAAGAGAIGTAAVGTHGGSDFLKTARFDPASLRGWDDYKLWGDNSLRPEQVFRDDNFTYIQFGDKWNDLELPTAYVVVDGIDELVNTRVQGTTFIVESTHRLITLKSGQSFLCIQYKGAK